MKNRDMGALTIVTGDHTNRLGTTKCQIGIINPAGSVIIRDLQNAGRGVQDVVKSQIPSATGGYNRQRLLGQWLTRTITAPDDTVMYLSYSAKTADMAFPRTIHLPIKVDNTQPWLEMLFPVITDATSSIGHLSLSGRFRLARAKDIDDDLYHVGDGMIGLPLAAASAKKFIEDIGEEVLSEYWASVVLKLRGARDEVALFEVDLGDEKKRIMVRKLLPAIRTIKKPVNVSRTVKSGTGKKIIVAHKRRRIKLS